MTQCLRKIPASHPEAVFNDNNNNNNNNNNNTVQCTVAIIWVIKYTKNDHDPIKHWSNFRIPSNLEEILSNCSYGPAAFKDVYKAGG